MKILFVFLLATLFFEVAQSATYYVATTGNNSANTGSSTKPWKTIAFAVGKMKPGDTTYVRGGIYKEGEIKFSTSGTSSSPIKLLSVPGQNPVINFIDPKNSAHRIIISHSSGYNKAIGYITIEGFEIRNGYNGIKFHNLHDSVIRRNWIHHNLTQGILGQGGHHNLFDRNRVNHNGNFVKCAKEPNACNQDHGYYMYGNYYTITNSLFYDNLAFGIQINGSPKSVYKSTANPSTAFAGAKYWVITNNTFAYNVNRAGMTVWGTPSTIRIENNIFHENCVKNASKCDYVQGIAMSDTARGVIIRNNLFNGTDPGAKLAWPGTLTLGKQYSQSGNIVNKGSPRLANAPAALPSSPNFALTSLSPAINKGVATTATKMDFKGVARPRGGAYDVGAHEF